MDIHYRLLKMEESEFMFRPDFDFGSIDKNAVNYQFAHQMKVAPEKSQLALNMVVEITPLETNEVIARESIYCVFWMDPFDKVIEIKDEGFVTSEPLLIDTFINIAIGALRGLLVKNLKGTELSGSVMPLIPMNVIRQNSMQQAQ